MKKMWTQNCSRCLLTVVMNHCWQKNQNERRRNLLHTARKIKKHLLNLLWKWQLLWRRNLHIIRRMASLLATSPTMWSKSAHKCIAAEALPKKKENVDLKQKKVVKETKIIDYYPDKFQKSGPSKLNSDLGMSKSTDFYTSIPRKITSGPNTRTRTSNLFFIKYYSVWYFSFVGDEEHEIWSACYWKN